MTMNRSGEPEGANLPPVRPESAESRDEPPADQIDRAAALAEGAPGVPAKFVFWALGIALVASLGGLLGEHVFSSVGFNPVPTTVPRPVATVQPAATPPAPTPDRSIDASLQSFMGLSTLPPKPAPPLTLVDQNAQATSVPPQPPRVVVLTFFNAPCNDICPVLAAEIERADTDLGVAAANVEFLTVNTDPSALASSADGPALSQGGLGALPNWRMLTGPLVTLNRVWRAYGLSISVDKKTDLEAHNDVMDFIDAQGELHYRATPFADESTTGTYSLPAASVARWGEGIATYAMRLVGQ
jgi:cytochrome oxidase Cu insertion factor (SCO1/SenC/PrrC family)